MILIINYLFVPAQKKHIYAKLTAKRLYIIVNQIIVPAYHSMVDTALNIARALIAKCIKLAIISGRLYIHPIVAFLSIQFNIANPRYNAPNICRNNIFILSKSISRYLISSTGINENIAPRNHKIATLNTINIFVFIFLLLVIISSHKEFSR